MSVFQKAFAVLAKKPIRLWGISLLGTLLGILVTPLFGIAIPILGICVSTLLSTSMIMVYLHGYRNEEVKAAQLFDCFKDWNTIKRVLCGVAWAGLWTFLWALIPVVGIVFAIIRVYRYRFVPYIMVHEPEVSITDALAVSTERTKGHKGQMFWGDVLPYVAVGVVSLVLGLFASIPYIGILFGIIQVVFYIAVLLFLPLYLGLVRAAFYEELTNSAPVLEEAPAAE